MKFFKSCCTERPASPGFGHALSGVCAPRSPSRLWRSSVRLLLFGALASGAPAIGAEPLTLAYAHRPGYADIVDSVPKGISIEIASRVVKAAKMDVTWELMVQPRQMAMLQRAAPNFCAIGLFKTPEREAFATFSNAYYRDRRLVIVSSRSASAHLRAKASFAQLLQDHDLEIGLLDSLSYGSLVDDMLKARGGVRRIEGKIEQVFKMVAAGRIDYTIASPEEVEPIMAMAGVGPSEVKIIHYPDLPDGNLRYFLCSKAVDQGVIDRLNAGIAALKIDLH